MLKDHRLSGQSAAPAASIDTLIEQLQSFEDEDLMRLRHELDMVLNVGIADLNLTEELGLQYRQAKILLADVQKDQATPANQKAQVFNSVQSMLAQIVKLQSDVYTMQRLKRFEAAWMKAAETLGDEAKQAFFDLYSEFLGDKGV